MAKLYDLPPGRRLWLVGQFKATTPEGNHWEFQGVFGSEEKAVAACRGWGYFVQPVTLDEPLPDETVWVRGSYYPHARAEGIPSEPPTDG